MGSTATAARRAASATRTNSTLVLTSFLLGTTMATLGLALSVVPIVGPLVSVLFVTPITIVGLLGLAVVGLDRRATRADLERVLRTYYVRVVGAYALFQAAVVMCASAGLVAVGIASASVLDLRAALADLDPVVVDVDLESRAVVDVDLSGLDLGAVAPAVPPLGDGLAVTAAVGLTLVLVAGFVGFATVQFFDVSIVADDATIRASFVASWRLFREAPLDVCGYTLARTILSGVVLVPLLVGAWVAVVLEPGPGVVAIVGFALLGCYAIGQAYLWSFHAAYYDERRGTAVDHGLDGS